MTRPDGDAANGTAAIAASARPRGPRGARFRRWLVDAGWVHVVLVCGAALFLFPFAWMVGTSLKTDEEIAENRLFPRIPTFRPASPYLRDVPEPRRPDDAPEARWRAVLPQLLERVATDLAAAPPAPVPSSIDLGEWRRRAAGVVVEKLAAQLPNDQWRGDDAAIVAALAARETPEAMRAAFDETLARIELTGVQWVSNDNHIANLAMGAGVADAFAVDGPATLTRDQDTARLAYRFDGDRPVVLTFAFPVPPGFVPDELHKLVVSLRPDDSWHRLDAEFEIGARRWVSQRTTYLGMHRPMALIFQPPGFDDTTYRARTWIPLRDERGDAPPSGAGATRGVLRLTVSPSSAARAIWGKVARNYQRAFWSVPFWTYVGNSVLLVALTMGGALFSSAWVAYAFARLSWPGRGVALMVLLSTMMLPGQVTMIPGFLIWCQLGWYNTLNPLWIGAWFGNAFFIFLMVQQMRTIPKELEEAARIDGFNAVQTWWYIIVPQVKPTLAGIAIMTFMGAWNEFMGPLIFLRDQSKFPLSLGLFGMSLEGADWAMLMAGNLLMTAPVIVIFFFCQRYFIQGVTMTGVKG